MVTAGNAYPVAFLLFHCAQCPGNYANHARESIVKQMEKFDPGIRSPERRILSGDLLPHVAGTLQNMINSDDLDVDLSRLKWGVARKLKKGKWPGDTYVAGVIFVVSEGVDLLHRNVREAGVAGYLGTFTIPIFAGSTDIIELAKVLRLSDGSIMERI